jgi:ATP-binding cassette subfamily B protein
MFHGGGGWGAMMHGDDARPHVTWALLRRVLAYARPYYRHIALLLLVILLSAVLSLITPLIFRDLIDHTLPRATPLA